MSFKIDGLDDLQKELFKIQKNIKEVSNKKTLSLSELFTTSFMSKYTNFSTFDNFLKAGNFTVNSQEDFEAIPDEEMDIHVGTLTSFSSWEDMLEKATEEYLVKKLNF